MRGRILIGVAVFAACASTGASTSTSTSASDNGAFRPGAEGAKSYATSAGADGRRPVPDDPVRRSLLAEVRAAARKAKVRPPEEDARLDWAMTDLARHLPGDQLPALEVVDFLLTHYGLIEPSPHMLLVSASPQGPLEMSASGRAELVEMLRTAAIRRVGIGVDRSADTLHIVFGLQESHLKLLKAVPRRLPSGGQAPIAARIDAGLTNPEVVITAPGGAVAEQTPPLRKGDIAGDLRCAADGRYQVEIVASGATGSFVLANFSVYCGAEPPAATPRGTGVRAAAVTAQEAETQIVALINRDRKLAGVAPVVVDDKLTAIARAHTQDMVDHDFVGHVSPRTGSTMDRVRRTGLAPTFVSENVGRGYTADEAEQGFMASPGHRANIVDPRPARVGVGVVFGAPVSGTRPLFVTQLFSN